MRNRSGEREREGEGEGEAGRERSSEVWCSSRGAAQSRARRLERGEVKVSPKASPEASRWSPHLEEHDLAKRALRVGRVLKRVEYLLERHHLTGALILGAPHDAIGSLSQFLDDIILPQYVPVDLIRPEVVDWAW